jgi:hypothetical protein
LIDCIEEEFRFIRLDHIPGQRRFLAGKAVFSGEDVLRVMKELIPMRHFAAVFVATLHQEWTF